MLSVSLHPSGKCFATGGSDSKVKLWDIGTRSCLQTVCEHIDQVTCDGEGGRGQLPADSVWSTVTR